MCRRCAEDASKMRHEKNHKCEKMRRDASKIRRLLFDSFRTKGSAKMEPPLGAASSASSAATEDMVLPGKQSPASKKKIPTRTVSMGPVQVDTRGQTVADRWSKVRGNVLAVSRLRSAPQDEPASGASEGDPPSPDSDAVVEGAPPDELNVVGGENAGQSSVKRVARQSVVIESFFQFIFARLRTCIKEWDLSGLPDWRPRLGRTPQFQASHPLLDTGSRCHGR